jgi:CRP-like cAMP-binding protein
VPGAAWLFGRAADLVSIEVLKSFNLFTGFNERELTEIDKLCRERTYEDGSVIFTSGGSATNVYLLRAGKVAIQIEFVIYEHEIRATVYTVGKGEAFGWSALVPPHRLTASARCQGKADVITIMEKT